MKATKKNVLVLAKAIHADHYRACTSSRNYPKVDDRGNIYFDQTPEEVKAKHLIPIPPEDEKAVMGMNRKQRRAWAAQQRKKARADA